MGAWKTSDVRWGGPVQRYRGYIVQEIIEQMRAVDHAQTSGGRPNYAWLSRRRTNHPMTKEQHLRLERLTSQLDLEGCHVILKHLRATSLDGMPAAQSLSVQQVFEIAERMMLQVIEDRQTADLLRSVTETRRRSSLLSRRFSEHRVAPLVSSVVRDDCLRTVSNSVLNSQPTTRRESVKKSVSFSNKSSLNWSSAHASGDGDRQLILQPILKRLPDGE